MADDVDGHRRHLPALDRGAQPAQPSTRARPVPRLGVQDADPALRSRCSTSSSSVRLPPTRPTCSRPIADDRPDLVVSSFFAVGAMVGAEAAGLPYDVLFPNPYMLPAPGMPPVRAWASSPPRARSVGCATAPSTASPAGCGPRASPASTSCGPAHGLAPLDTLLRPDPRCPSRSSCSPRPTSTSRPSCPPTSATSARCSTTRRGRRRRGRRRRATTRSCSWRCRPRSRTTPAASSASSTPSARSRCAASSPPVPPSTPATSPRPPTCRSCAAAPHSEVLRSAAAVVTHGGHGTVDPGARRRRPARRAPPRARPGRQRRSRHGPGRRSRGEAQRVARRHRQGGAAAARRPVVPHRCGPPRSLDPARRGQRRADGRARGPASGSPRTGVTGLGHRRPGITRGPRPFRGH